jgi:hypothetical protein
VPGNRLGNDPGYPHAQNLGVILMRTESRRCTNNQPCRVVQREMVRARFPGEHRQGEGRFFLITLPFLPTPFGSSGHFYALSAPNGQVASVLYLCQIAPSSSLHNYRYGIQFDADAGYLLSPFTSLKLIIEHFEI